MFTCLTWISDLPYFYFILKYLSSESTCWVGRQDTTLHRVAPTPQRSLSVRLSWDLQSVIYNTRRLLICSSPLHPTSRLEEALAVPSSLPRHYNFGGQEGAYHEYQSSSSESCVIAASLIMPGFTNKHRERLRERLWDSGKSLGGGG